MAAVVFQHVAKVYPDGIRAVDDLTLAVRDGEFVVIVGPSGSGKTTALRMVAGLEAITEGTVSIGDRVVNHLPARDRDIAMVFQSYALYPHLSVFENIAFGLKVKKVPRPEIVRRVQHAAEENRLLQGTVELREELGPELFVHFGAPDVQLAETATIAELPRDTSALRASSDSSAVLVGRFGPDSAVREGEPVDAVVDTGRLHFFDPDTGRGIYAIDKEGAIT